MSRWYFVWGLLSSEYMSGVYLSRGICPRTEHLYLIQKKVCILL